MTRLEEISGRLAAMPDAAMDRVETVCGDAVSANRKEASRWTGHI